jgi:hypothetical protein
MNSAKAMQLVDADRESTWPDSFLQWLEANRDAIDAFQRERARIDRGAWDDVMLRINRPENPDQDAWDAALLLAGDTVASAHLLGFHATRLMEHEITEIRRNGLEPLSVDLLTRRLVAARQMGAVTAKQVARFLRDHQAADDNRSGRTAFFFTRAQLDNGAGVDRLCRSWGGEALYNSHEDDKETGPLLRSLGSPCIVVAAVRVADIEPRFDIGYRLLNVWCARRGIVTEHSPQFGAVVRVHTPAENIVRIISFGDPEFLTLTQHDRWRRPLS